MSFFNKRGGVKSFAFPYIIIFIFILLLFFAFFTQNMISLSPGDRSQSDAPLADDGTVKGETEGSGEPEGGIAGGSTIFVSECDYIVPPDPENPEAVPYVVYHITSPDSTYILTGDVAEDSQNGATYPGLLKACFEILVGGEITIEGAGHSILHTGPPCEGICTIQPVYPAFFFNDSVDANLYIHDLHIESDITTAVKANPSYFDGDSQFHFSPLYDNVIEIYESQFDSLTAIDMAYTDISLYAENSSLGKINLDYCNQEGNCVTAAPNPQSTINFSDVIVTGEISTSSSSYGGYDIYYQSLHSNLNLDGVTQVRFGFPFVGAPAFPSHLTLRCRENGNSFCGSFSDSTSTFYSTPMILTVAKEHLGAEVWFGAVPSGYNIPAGSAGSYIQGNGFMELAHLSNNIQLLHNFVSINTAQNQWAEPLNRQGIVVLHDNPGAGFTNPTIMKNGIACTDCKNFTPLNSQTVIFNVSSFGPNENYSLGEGQLPVSFDISQSISLTNGIVWSNVLPATNNSPANGNNGNGATSYTISIDTQNTNVDVYVKANSSLIFNGPQGNYTIPIANEKYSFSSSDSSVTGATKIPLDFTFAGNSIGMNLTDNSIIYLKFFLDTPSAQPPGNYNNLVQFIAVPSGSSPP